MNKKGHDKPIDKDFADFDDEITADVAEQPAQPRTEIPKDAAATQELLNKISSLEDKLLRTQAEMENIRRRGEAEVTKTHKYAVERFARELLAVVDNLERALEQKVETEDALRTGVELTLKLLISTLEKNAIKPINPLGEPFDPSQQEAMSMQESAEHPSGTVINVLQKGYMLHDRLLRPALVVVSKAPASA